MRRTEHMPLQNDPVQPKEYVVQEDLDKSSIFVHERAEGQYKAEFILELSGVDCNGSLVRSEEGHEDMHKWKVDAYIGSLLASLSDTQSIAFRYGWNHDTKDSAWFNWSIKGGCMNTEREKAIVVAQSLRHSVNVALGIGKADYKFESASGHSVDQEETAAWQYEIQPVGVIVPTTKIKIVGFATPKVTNGGILLSLPPGNMNPGFDAVVTGGALCESRVSVIVTIEALELDMDTMYMISAAHRNLVTGESGQINYQSHVACSVYDDMIPENVIYRLGRWMSDPRGYRVYCKVMADRDIPHSLLESVGRELFNGLPIVIRMTKGKEASVVCEEENDEQENVLDLRNCFHPTTDTMNLFPDTSLLAEAGVRRIYGRAPANLPEDGLLLGQCGHGRAKRDVSLSQSGRDRHCYVIGATGTGKSTLLYNMVMQDIKNGEGVCMIDPHGDLYRKVLESMPEERIDDVVLVDLCDFDYPVGMNFLECNGAYKAVQMNFIVNEMMMIFQRLYDMNVVGGPMFEMYMRNALLLVMDNDHINATLLDVVRVFEDKEVRRSAISQCNNPMVVSFWKEQAEKAAGDAALKNIAPYITCKLNQFTHNALLRPIIGQSESTIDFRKVMDDGKIILVNLSKGLLGELDTQLLGMMIIGKIFNAAMGRISLPPEERRPYYLYVDEFQNITTSTIAGMLSEARKFGLCLTLANQNMAQISDKRKDQGIMEAVLGNVATTLFFRMGPKDAETLDSYVKPHLSARDLQHLPDHQIACRMLNGNAPTTPFVFDTLPACTDTVPNERRRSITRRIVRESRQNHARSSESVNKEIAERWVNGNAERSETDDLTGSERKLLESVCLE